MQEYIYSGFEDGTFRPNESITREQLATIMHNYAIYKGHKVNQTNNLSEYIDAEQVAPYATAAMQWAVGTGIIGGKENNTLDPKGTATRAEIATIINRFLTKSQ